MRIDTTRDQYRQLLTAAQVSLLKAALLQGPGALEAWQSWKARVDIEQVDQGSFCLLPQLYRNLERLGVQDPLMRRLGGVYRQTWYRNHLLLRRAAALAPVFRRHRIEALLWKGAALVAAHYKDYGLRPLQAIDLLVRPEEALRAARVLAEEGWHSTASSPALRFQVGRSCGFRDEAGQQLILHVQPVEGYPQAEADRAFWEEAVAAEIEAASVRVLNPTDQLFHVCVDGIRWDGGRPLCWAADAVLILRASSRVDWHRLFAQAQKRRQALPLRNALYVLHDALGAPVPQEGLRRLQCIPVSRAERLEYRAATRPPGLLHLFAAPWLHYRRYLRLKSQAKEPSALPAFPGFLRDLWEAESLWQVPFYGVSRMVRRMQEAKGGAEN